jgi:predicted RNase H-like HicB family nuclease
MPHYIAVIHKETDSCYGVSFPDVPGVFTAGDTIDGATQHASEVLEFAAEDWQNPDGSKRFPPPRTIDELRADAEFQEDAANAVIAAVPFRVPAEAAEYGGIDVRPTIAATIGSRLAPHYSNRLPVTEPLKHHYIPVFYLKRWMGEDERISVFQIRHNDVRVKRKHPSATGYFIGLYTIPGLPEDQAQLLEKEFMQRTDDIAAKALELMLSADGKDLMIPPALRFGWARFVFSLILRSPESLEKMRAALVKEAEKVVEELRDKYPQVRRPEDPEDFDIFKKKFTIRLT